MNNENQIPDPNLENNPEPNIPPMENIITEAVQEPGPVISPNSLSSVPTDAVAVPPASYTNEEPKKKKKILPIILVVILVLSLALGGFFFFRIQNSPEKILLNSFNHLRDNVFASDFDFDLPEMNESMQRGTMDLNIAGTGTLAEMNEIFAPFNALGLSFELETRSDMAYFSLDLNHDDESMINLELMARDNMIYFFMESLFEQVLAIDFETDIFFEDSVTIEDLEYLFELILERFIRDMDSSAFTQSSASIRINGESKDVRKTNVTLNNDEIIALMNRMLTGLRNDNRANDILAGLFEGAEGFDLASFTFPSEIITRDVTLQYNVYTTGLFNNNVVGVDFILEMPEAEVEDWWGPSTTPAVSLVIEYRAEDNDTFYFRADNELLFRIVVERNNNEIIVRLFGATGGSFANLRFINPNSNTLNISLELEILGLELDIYFNTTIERVTAGSEYNIISVAGLNFSEGTEGIEGTATFRINARNLEGTSPDARFNTTNARNVNTLTWFEEEQINRNLENLFDELLERLIGSLFTVENAEIADAATCATTQLCDPCDGATQVCYFNEAEYVLCACDELDDL